jgi:hypothetical protein
MLRKEFCLLRRIMKDNVQACLTHEQRSNDLTQAQGTCMQHPDLDQPLPCVDAQSLVQERDSISSKG